MAPSPLPWKAQFKELEAADAGEEHNLACGTAEAQQLRREPRRLLSLAAEATTTAEACESSACVAEAAAEAADDTWSGQGADAAAEAVPAVPACSTEAGSCAEAPGPRSSSPVLHCRVRSPGSPQSPAVPAVQTPLLATPPKEGSKRSPFSRPGARLRPAATAMTAAAPVLGAAQSRSELARTGSASALPVSSWQGAAGVRLQPALQQAHALGPLAGAAGVQPGVRASREGVRLQRPGSQQAARGAAQAGNGVRSHSRASSTLSASTESLGSSIARRKLQLSQHTPAAPAAPAPATAAGRRRVVTPMATAQPPRQQQQAAAAASVQRSRGEQAARMGPPTARVPAARVPPALVLPSAARQSAGGVAVPPLPLARLRSSSEGLPPADRALMHAAALPHQHPCRVERSSTDLLAGRLASAGHSAALVTSPPGSRPSTAASLANSAATSTAQGAWGSSASSATVAQVSREWIGLAGLRCACCA